MSHTILVIDDRERLAPVALAGEEPIAQLVLNLSVTSTVVFQPIDRCGLGLVQAQAVDVQATVVRTIDSYAAVNESFFQLALWRLLTFRSDHLGDG